MAEIEKEKQANETFIDSDVEIGRIREELGKTAHDEKPSIEMNIAKKAWELGLQTARDEQAIEKISPKIYRETAYESGIAEPEKYLEQVRDKKSTQDLNPIKQYKELTIVQRIVVGLYMTAMPALLIGGIVIVCSADVAENHNKTVQTLKQFPALMKAYNELNALQTRGPVRYSLDATVLKTNDSGDSKIIAFKNYENMSIGEITYPMKFNEIPPKLILKDTPPYGKEIRNAADFSGCDELIIQSSTMNYSLSFCSENIDLVKLHQMDELIREWDKRI